MAESGSLRTTGEAVWNMFPKFKLQCQSRRYRFWLRKCPGQEDGPVRRTRTSRPHQEHNILPTLQPRFDLCEIVWIVDGVLIDFQNHVAAIQAHVFGERPTFDILHYDALTGGNVQAVCEILRDCADSEPGLRWFRLFRALTFLVLAQARGKELGAVGNRDSGLIFLAVAHVVEFGLGAGLPLGNVG